MDETAAPPVPPDTDTEVAVVLNLLAFLALAIKSLGSSSSCGGSSSFWSANADADFNGAIGSPFASTCAPVGEGSPPSFFFTTKVFKNSFLSPMSSTVNPSDTNLE